LARHRFHGDPTRFEVVADFVVARFPDARTAVDVAGGQGMLARLLSKHHNVACDVVDPRGWVLRGVSSRAEEYDASMADFYDVVIGLHPDEALRAVVASALVRPVVVVPCCNFWDRTRRLGRDELLAAIAAAQARAGGEAEPVTFAFRGPKNEGLVLLPPARRVARISGSPGTAASTPGAGTAR
jgi:hypothetical protein